MEHLEGAKQYCNSCGRVINVEGSSQEDHLQIRKVWSYFSSNELVGQSFNMCQACYNKMISNFKIPVEEIVIDDMPIYSDEQIDEMNAAYAAELCK
ncbi:MAG: hypothetical protein E7231_07905 [Cellulosilyticum sp.]|nr:hypothetical protein [Cellulosilyticum sp.]